MQTKNSGLLYCCLCNTSHGYAKLKCASAFGLLSSYRTTIRLKLNGFKDAKSACHSPAISAFIVPDAIVLYPSTMGRLFAPLLVCPWLQQYHSELSFSWTAFIWQHHDIYHKSQEQVFFAALPQDLETHLLVQWAILPWANVILDLSKNTENQTTVSWERQI